MASYYPEGECFFKRSSLVYADQWSAENESQFYSHVLVEHHWNGWYVAKGSYYRKESRHLRSKLVTGFGANYGGTMFGVYDKLYVGESSGRDVSNMLAITSVEQSQDFNECRDLDQGGPRKYILRPIPIRNKETQWLWIDGTIPLRAIYFPVAHKSEQAFQDYCTYVVIDFRARERVRISDVAGNWKTYPITTERGLGYVREVTWGFNVPDIITYLSVPRQLRNPEQGLFRAAKAGDELVVRASYDREWKCPEPTLHIPRFYREIDFAKIVSATFGIEVGWRPYKYSSFIVDLLQKALSSALSVVPGVGPLLSVAFSMAWEAMSDPDAFSQEDVLRIGGAVMEIVLASAAHGKKFVAPDFLKKGSTTRTARRRRSVLDPIENALEGLTGSTDDEREAKKEADEREASEEADEAWNAQITEMKREIYGDDPPQSQTWQERRK